MDHQRLSDVGAQRPRPKSASFTGRVGTADLMLASTPDLSHSGYSDPIFVDQDLFTSTTSGIENGIWMNWIFNSCDLMRVHLNLSLNMFDNGSM